MVLVVPVLLLVAVLVSAYDDSTELTPEEDESKLLAKSIRLKLMQDNYDYSREDINNTVTENINKNARRKKKTRKNFYVSELAVDEKDEKENIVSKANKNKKVNKNADHVMSKKDLLYYIDDERFDTEKSGTKSTVKYKFLKDRRQYRRSGQARLIQEENKEGVAIVNLDKGPFPELRLPNSRRQYMHDRGDAMIDDEEVPPPTVNTSDPEAAADDIDNQTATGASILTTI
ncbi:uncharacterized protein LOC123667600 isoform X2 [Melitaea cinxia]|nr:uncharacterized protein LOC123667600 isoform X2 [Melitaea cinxia]